jgi:predicted DNA-binding transcriptional regulator AlpA
MQNEPIVADQLITDTEAQRLLAVGRTKLFELQKQPDFPTPLWLGPRLKRHRREALLQWALSRASKPEPPR